MAYGDEQNTFDEAKKIFGGVISSAVAIYPNACRYTVNGALDKRGVTTGASITSSYTGNLTVSGGDPLFFITSDPYLIIDSEIIKITVVDATNITITERAKFGTVAASHAATSAKIVHSGEADGSCRGYPKRPDGGGCSTNDSFSRDAEREFLFINGQSFDGQIYYNGLKKIEHNPCEVKPSEEMAKNASCSVTISDNTDDDVYSVPYPERRTSNATLFKKLIARTGGYLQNRRAITYSGFESSMNFNKDNCIEREYIIDSISLNKSTFQLKLFDPLILAEESKTKIPEVSNGKLLNAIVSGSTTIELKDFDDGEYGANTDAVTLKIDNELISCTVTDSATGTFSITTRAVGGSEEKDHSVNASAQRTIVLADFNPISEIITALETTNIQDRFYGDYTEAIDNTANATGPVYIHKPASVAKYVNTIIRTWAESNITLYFDEKSQKIKIKSVGDFEQQPITLTYTDDIKQNSLNVKQMYDKQLTRSSIGFAPFNAAKKVDDDNSSVVFQSINVLTELTGTLEPQSDKTFYTQFLSNSDTDVQIAVGGASRRANLNTKAPEIFTFDIDSSNYGNVEGGIIEEGEIINVTTQNTVDDDGLPVANNLQILSLRDNSKNSTYTLKAITYQDIVNEADFDFVIDTDKENYDLSTEYAPTEIRQHVIFIKSGVTIGATSVSNIAFTTGAQSAGVTLKIIHRGSILAAGGRGAEGVDFDVMPLPYEQELQGLDGFSGGDAFFATVDLVIDSSQGVIYSGGGGAPSTKASGLDFGFPTYYAVGSDGGGGGQGYVGGAGGLGGTTTAGNLFDIGTDAPNGSRSAAGSLGGISGGSWGSDSDEDHENGTGNKGLSGFAIKSNGNNVTIIGDNDLTIKGRRS